MALNHAFTSAVADGADATLVRPSNWNADHVVSGTSLQLLFNNAGSLTGMSGTSWDDTNRSLTLTGATVTASKPIFDLSQTWNNAAVVFTGLKLNVTNTASAVKSPLIDIQLGGVTKLAFIQAPQTGFAPQLNFGPATNAVPGLRATGSGLDVMLGDGSSYTTLTALSLNTPTAIINNAGACAMVSDTGQFQLGASYDVTITRDGAGILAQRNGVNAQSLRVYNTYTDASNYERGVFDWSTTANTLTIGTQKLGTGTARNVAFVAGGITGALMRGSDGNFDLTGTKGDFSIYNASVFIFGVSTSNTVQTNQLNPYFDATYALGTAPTGAYNGGWTALYLSIGAKIQWSTDTGIARNGAGVLEINNGTAGTLTGSYLHWGGQARVTADFTVSNSTVLTNVTGLSVTVAAGRTYTFETELFVTDAAAGGVQAAIAGTATATAIQYTGYTIADNAIKAKTNATALATAVGSTTTTETSGIVVRITGTITVNAGGTLTVQMAQNTSNATATTAVRGSYFIVHDMP